MNLHMYRKYNKLIKVTLFNYLILVYHIRTVTGNENKTQFIALPTGKRHQPDSINEESAIEFYYLGKEGYCVLF